MKVRFTVDYRSDAGAWQAGDETELDEDFASWLNRDIPGCVEPVDEADDAGERQQPKRQNRQQRGKQNRSA